MAKRQNVQRIDSEVVQGEGSWVDIKRPTHGERKALLIRSSKYIDRVKPDGTFDTSDLSKNDLLELNEFGTMLLVEMVVGWDWVDDDGDPLPQVQDKPAVFDLLTDQEMAFLNQHVTPALDEKKEPS